MMNPLLALLAVLLYLWVVFTKANENVFLKQLLNKFRIFFNAVAFMVMCKDNKGVGPKYNPDPELLKDKTTFSKKIVFIRHGESDWNNVFNKGINVGFLVRLATALYNEMLMFTSVNSSFIDSPLNAEGHEQAIELARFLTSEAATIKTADPNYSTILCLAGVKSHSSVIVSSCLRRAIATTTLGLWPRISKSAEKIHVLSSLQEMSRNIDTYALSAPGTTADLPFDRITPHCADFVPSKVYDNSQNFGTKTLDFYGIKRLRGFGEWALQQTEETIIVGGHSLWFKSFFQTFMPFGAAHDAKAKKMTNSGVVSFTLQGARDGAGEMQFRIDPASVRTVYGGFTTK